MSSHEHTEHAHHHHDHAAHGGSLNRVAFSATAHCLTGCAIGEVLGVIIGTALGWGNFETIVLAIALAFLFGYSLTMLPLLRAGLAFAAAVPLALASDTLSIAVMEFVDNAILLVVPGAMEAGLDTLLFWASLAFALLIAGMAAYPVNRYLIARGKGHAVVHAYHGH
jgi:Domain of unknown function (DUF4396)